LGEAKLRHLIPYNLPDMQLVLETKLLLHCLTIPLLYILSNKIISSHVHGL